ncbi:MAG: hypothetical protein KYX69_10400 [Sphingomonas sp.]|uniref:hypothetical protein n=1 Tax=Sphingomonas sp. TaxID=28214 RepID=UPI00261CF34A|nr:hypothetical protein [Sphingomonas sp.]MDK2768113.1 hypothetical protein [Sphingomonas sp.]
MFSRDRLFADVKTFSEAGNKRSGGAGDRRTADWIAERLARSGFSVERQRFDAPWFESSACELTIGEAAIGLLAQPIPATTSAEGIVGRLCLAESPDRLDGAIAVVRLPYRRWSSLLDGLVSHAVADVLERGAEAVILVTTGPTGEALLLNAPADRPAAPRPVALLAPKLAGPVIEAARFGRVARLVLTGRGGTRPAENVLGRVVRPERPWLVVSTPRSGWTDCAGERGPGVAIWLALAEWMPKIFARHSLLFVANSGHEYENLGASHLVHAFGPPQAETEFWLHLGANVATRDWQEIPGRLLPLPSADPNRFLMTSPDLVEHARAIFKGQPGIEMAYPSSEGTAGELSEIVKSGYLRHAGIFGAHRHHHAATDTLATIAPDLLAITALGLRALLLRAVPPTR